MIFTFDGDAAGRKAALRAFSLEEKFVTQTFVAVQPDGLDPCDLRISRGDAAVRDLIARRVPLFEFAIRSVLDDHDLNTAEGRLAALDAAAPIVAKIKDRSLRQLYAVSLDRWTGIMNEGFVLERVGQHAGSQSAPQLSGRGRGGPGGRAGRPADGRGGGPAEGSPAANVPRQRAGELAEYDSRDPVIQVEREALKLAVQRPALCGPAFDALGLGCFTAPVHAAAFEVVAGCGGTSSAGGGREWAERLRNAAPDDHVRAFITQLAVEPMRAPGVDGEPDARYIEAQFARVEELSLSRDIARVKSRLQRMNPVTEQAEYNRMFGDLVALEQRRKVLSGPAADALQ